MEKSTGEGIGVLLAQARQLRGISRGQLAHSAGCSRQYIEMLESGDRTRPTARALAAFAAALELQGAERTLFFVAAGLVPPAVTPAGRYDAASLAANAVRALTYPAFVLDGCWSLLHWNQLVSPVFETYFARLPAGSHNLLEIVLRSELRSRVLNWEEAAPALVGQFKRDTRPAVHSPQYRQVLRLLRSLPGFPALFKATRPATTVTASSLLGIAHSRCGALWFATAVTTFAGREEPRLVAFVPADPATATVMTSLAPGERPQT